MDKETQEQIRIIKSLIRDFEEKVRNCITKVDELERIVKKDENKL